MGKLVDSLIIGVICFIGTYMMGIKSALLVSVVVGVTNIIPFFGPYIGAVPSTLWLLLENPLHAFLFFDLLLLCFSRLTEILLDRRFLVIPQACLAFGYCFLSYSLADFGALSA